MFSSRPILISSFIVLLGFHVLINQKFRRPVPMLEEDGFYGPGEVSKDDDQIHPFKIDVSEERLTQLKDSLAHTRLPQALDDGGSNGLNLEFLRNISKHMENYDWKQHQHFFNTFKHFKTEIEGLSIHFVRITTQPAEGKQLVPLLLLHGFPGSWWDFFKVAPILSNPHRYGFDFGVRKPILFDVIIPSLPGFLWSDKPMKKDFGLLESARILNKLMARLDVPSYFVHGQVGVGTELAATMGVLYPKNILGLHLSNPFLPPNCDLQTTVHYWLSTLGYRNDGDRITTGPVEYLEAPQFQTVQRSDALAVSLLNSPMGLASFILDKWSLYSNGNKTKDEEKLLHQMFTVDELITEVHLYWLTDTIPYALRLLENSRTSENYCLTSLATVTVPTAIVQSPDAPWRSSRFILDNKFHNITRYTILPKGGLFHGLQDANSLAADIFGFVEIQLL